MQASLLNVLSALGNAVINSFWQMGLLWLLVIGITKYRKNISANVLGGLAFMALITGFAAFLFTFAFSLITIQTDAGILFFITNTFLVETILKFAAAAYLVLLLFPVTKFGIGFFGVQKLKRKGLHRAPGKYKIFLLDTANLLGIKRTVKLWISELVDTPLTVGFLKPVILLPVAVVNNLSTTQVEAIILHELAHIRQNDYLRNLISQIIVSLLYFNPFAKMLVRLQSSEMEKTADNWVLQFQYNNHLYASTLLEIARNKNGSQPQLALHASGEKSQLYDRVQWIMGLRDRAIPSVKKITSATGLMVFLFLFSIGTKNTSVITQVAKPIGGNIEISETPQFAVSHKNNYNVQKIPALETTSSAGRITVYLKQVENSETSKIEIITPKEEANAPEFVFTTGSKSEAPVLSPEKEQRVQQYIAAAKKIVAENNWVQIENELAESVTSSQKALLKQVYLQLMEPLDWSQQADKLRLSYENINWDEVHSKFNMAFLSIRLDSIQQHYRTALEKYEEAKKGVSQAKAAEMDLKIQTVEKILNQADSLRKKRIVEL